MEVLTVPLFYAGRGEDVAIPHDPIKVLIHHLRKMTERDWTIPWPIPTCLKKMVKCNLSKLKDPYVTEQFGAYDEHRQAFMEVGKKPILPNPSNIVLGYIYANYSLLDEANADIVIVPPGFLWTLPTTEEQQRFRRIKRGIFRRVQVNETVEKDELWEVYVGKLSSDFGYEEGSRDYVLKAIEYWGELTKNQGKRGLTGYSPSQDPHNIILITPINEYSHKHLRERFRWIQKYKLEWATDWAINNPNADLTSYPGRMTLVEDYDKIQAEKEVKRLKKEVIK